MNDTKFPTIQGIIGHKNYKRLTEFSASKNISISRLVGIAVFKEMQREDKFSWPDKFPEDEVSEFAYINEASMIYEFFKHQVKPVPLDFLLLIREDIGIVDEYAFLMGLKECLNKKLVSRIVRTVDSAYYKAGTVLYGLKGQDETIKKLRTKQKEYENYKRLEKKYKNV